MAWTNPKGRAGGPTRLADDITLPTDADSCFTPSRAIKIGRFLEDHGFAHFEEPCPNWELDWTKEVTDALDIDVAGQAGLRPRDLAQDGSDGRGERAAARYLLSRWEQQNQECGWTHEKTRSSLDFPLSQSFPRDGLYSAHDGGDRGGGTLC